MPILDADSELDVRATAVRVSEAELTVEFEDGRTLSVPTAWYPRLHHSTQKERGNFEIGAVGQFLNLLHVFGNILDL